MLRIFLTIPVLFCSVFLFSWNVIAEETDPFKAALQTYETVDKPSGDELTSGLINVKKFEGGSDKTFLVDILKKLTTELFKWVGFLAVVLIIYAGARRIWSVWNEKEVEASTTTLQNAIIGLIAALFAVPVIRAITAVFEDIGLTDISEGKPTEAVQNTIGAWIQQVLFPVLGPLAVIGVLWVAYRYLFAMGDSGKIESANKSLSAILVGIVIVLFAYAIVSFLTSLSLG